MNSKTKKISAVGIGLIVAVGIGLAVFFFPAFAAIMAAAFIGCGLTTLSMNITALAITTAVLFGGLASILTACVDFVIEKLLIKPSVPAEKLVYLHKNSISTEVVAIGGAQNPDKSLEDILKEVEKLGDKKGNVREYFDNDVNRQAITKLMDDPAGMDEDTKLGFEKLTKHVRKYREILVTLRDYQAPEAARIIFGNYGFNNIDDFVESGYASGIENSIDFCDKLIKAPENKSPAVSSF